jgi:transcriptional regulator with XRE-family HTH domain
MDMPGFDVPAASQYAAATPELLAWFKGYNERHPEGERVFPFGFLLSLQAKSRVEMAREDPKALSHELWRRREPRPAAPYFKRAIDAKDHAFDREHDEPVPASWLKSHGRSLVRYHLHQETKFWGGEYDQRGPLRRRHIFALTHLPIGKEADQIEESEYIGEEAGPLEHPLAARDHAELAAFIAETKKLRKITDRALLGRAGVSAHTLRNLRKGVPISDKSLFQLVRATEQLHHETEPVAAVNAGWLQKPREVLTLARSQNKLAKLMGVSRPYLGRVLSEEKPITAAMIERIRAIRI